MSALTRPAKWLLARLPFFFTFHMRPKYARDVQNWLPLAAPPAARVAIVLQGPLWHGHGFTLETLRLYRKHCPDAVVILSTWDDEDPVAMARARDEGVELVLNRKPAEPGLWNMNLQIASAQGGLSRAKALGAEFALKTRTDIRFYAPHFERFLLSVIACFPLRSESDQRCRIVGFNVGTLKHRQYALADLNLFGHIDDLLLYFAPGLDENYRRSGIDPAGKVLVPESYFATRYLGRLGIDLQWTGEDSDRMFATRFCVLDEGMVDMYWIKYNAHREHKYVFYSKADRPDHAYLTFRDWLMLYDRYDRYHAGADRASPEAYVARGA